MKRGRTHKRGFTLIELIVVIAICIILATIIVFGCAAAVERARVARAQIDLRAIQRQIMIMKNDTGELPYHCNTTTCRCPNYPTSIEWWSWPLSTDDANVIANDVGGAAISLYNKNGLTANDGYRGWAGPYLEGFHNDPWGHPYYISPDYFCGAGGVGSGYTPWGIGKYEDACAGQPVGSYVMAVASWGRDKMTLNTYEIRGGDNVAFSICKP